MKTKKNKKNLIDEINSLMEKLSISDLENIKETAESKIKKASIDLSAGKELPF